MNCRACHLLLLMIVHDLNVDRPGGGLRPLEADPPLVVDANAVLALSVPAQRFEPVTGQRSKVADGRGGLEAIKFQPRGPFESRECLDPFPSGESPGPLVPIADD